MLDENIHKINIIITYFRDLVNIKYSENTEISDICNQLEKNHTKLKIYLLDIETVVFSSDSYVNDRLAYIWNIQNTQQNLIKNERVIFCNLIA